MFLDENYIYNSEVSADPTYGAQLIQEASDSWNDLCMKMIKLEHTAIVQEDTGLLQEGIREFGESALNHAKYAGQKFLQYLEQVRVQWTKIQASIATKICNPTMIQNLLSKAKLNKVTTTFTKEKLNLANKLIAEYGNVKEDLNKLIAETKPGVYKVQNGNNAAFYKFKNSAQSNTKLLTLANKIQELPTDTTPKVVDANDVNDAIKFLKQRPIAIKNIEIMKKYVTVAMKEQMKAAGMKGEEKLSQKNSIVSVQRYCNHLIIAINSGTSTAIKICNAVKQNGVSEKKDISAAKKAAREGKHNYVIAKESVLDLFD